MKVWQQRLFILALMLASSVSTAYVVGLPVMNMCVQ
jgi:hypothetical protein